MMLTACLAASPPSQGNYNPKVEIELLTNIYAHNDIIVYYEVIKGKNRLSLVIFCPLPVLAPVCSIESSFAFISSFSLPLHLQHRHSGLLYFGKVPKQVDYVLEYTYLEFTQV